MCSIISARENFINVLKQCLNHKIQTRLALEASLDRQRSSANAAKLNSPNLHWATETGKAVGWEGRK